MPKAHGGRLERIDSRSLCLARETLARHDGLADFAFAMQGLGSGAISLAGSPALRERYLPRVAQGEAIAAFALSEPDAGSDVAAMSTRAREAGGEIVIDGTKTWISNGGIADFYTVFARETDAPGAKGISAFVVDADSPGLAIAERIEVIAPHPLARLAFTDCRIPASQRLGAPGRGLQGGDADARRLPRLGRGRGARVRAPRARRGDRACHLAQDVRPDAGRLPAHAGRDRGHGDRDRLRRPC